MAITFALIGADNWQDFEAMFLKHGGVYGGCWCTFHLLSSGEFNKMEKLDRKAYHQQAIFSGKSSGLIMYMDNQPVGWCQFGPAQNFEQINRTKAYKALVEAASSNQIIWPEPVWRITCLFIDKHYRRQGLRDYLIKEAIEAIRIKGGGIVEAFPLQIEGNHAPQYTGSIAMYERHGFQAIAQVGKSKILMRLDLRS